MSPLRDLFSRQQPGAGTKSPVENWPPPPLVKPLPAGRSGMAVFPDLPAGTQLAPAKYGPAIVIGLGKAGEIALRQWLEELAQDPSGPQKGLHILLITRTPPEPLPENIVKTRILPLEDSKASSMVNMRTSMPTGARADSSLRFRQAANYNQFIGWLGDCLLDLRTQIRVFVVGSLAEPEIGVLGDVLQILRIQPESPGKSNPYANVTALLSLDASGTEKIPPQDIYAALREIGRFTYNGPHIYETDFNLHSTRMDAAPLDHVFLLENRLGFSADTFEGTSFDRGLGQAFAEFLFTMTHPASRSLWQNLSNELYQDTGHLHSTTHRVFIHSFGAATLYVPVGEIQAYIAARLSQAAIYGERPDIPEGLLARKSAEFDSQAKARLLAEHWLSAGPYSHKLFEWLLNANGPGYFRTIPSLSAELDAVFQAQLSYNLVGFLNDSAGSDLETARLTLESIKTKLDQIEKWFKAAPDQNSNNIERLTLQGFLNNWHQVLQHLISTIGTWQKSFRPLDDVPGTGSTSTDWRTQIQSSDPEAPVVESEKKIGVWAVMQQARKAAEKDLKESAHDRIYRPVTADRVNELAEIELYYVDTIRPELSRYIKESNTNFTRVRERLEWWINLVPGSLPELLLLCWPVDCATSLGVEPPAEACFKPANASAFGQALLRVARTQVKGRAGDLAGPWFENRILTMVEFLRRATDAYLVFDEDLAISLPNAASRNSYLLARDLTISQKHLNDVFPTASLKTRQALGDGERTRLTALTFRLNIPLDAIQSVETLQSEYQKKSSQPLHIYRQEATSTIYEKRIWEMDRERILFSPQSAITLMNQQLVTLFCQALIAGLLIIRYDSRRQNPQWTMEGIGKWDALRLDSSDLWVAFNNFVLEKPYDPKLNEKPSSPFYSQKRSEYLAQLQVATKERMRQPDYSESREKFKKLVLAKWQETGEHNLLAKTFSYLLKVEFDEPVWKGW